MKFSNKIVVAVIVGLMSFSGVVVAEDINTEAIGNAIGNITNEIDTEKTLKTEPLNKVRISWETIPGAVSYRLVITDGDSTSKDAEVKHFNLIPNNGYELDTANMFKAKDYYWRVCPLDYDGNVMGAYSDPKPLVGEEVNPKAPLATAEFEKMAYMPLYPVFSWIPVDGSGGYEIRVSRENKFSPGRYEVVRVMTTKNNVYYEEGGYTWPGHYMWQVRSQNKAGEPNTEWSEPKYFDVESHVRVAAMGDSITHGGGVCNVPPGYAMYSWEYYCQVPVKNLGRSGDSVQDMAQRFDQDVMAFTPGMLIIMGGVNNFRAGEDGWDTIAAMEQILAECQFHNVIPVFVTATPINPGLMSKVPTIEPAAWNWKEQQQLLNQWIKNQPYHVDVTPALTDANGQLKAELTTDGLHPDHLGKKIIGETISNYLLTTFPNYNLTAK